MLLLIFALELGAGITGYMMRGEVGNMLENRLNNTMRQYNSNDEIRHSWDVMQHDVSSLNDLLYIYKYYTTLHLTLSINCCKKWNYD